jgi:hypothetical protein
VKLEGTPALCLSLEAKVGVQRSTEDVVVASDQSGHFKDFAVLCCCQGLPNVFFVD